MPPRRSRRQAEAASREQSSSRGARSTSSVNHEESKKKKKQERPVKEVISSKKNDATEVISSVVNTSPSSPSPIPTSSSPPPLEMPPAGVGPGTQNTIMPLHEFGFSHSLEQCLLICALKSYVHTNDGKPLTTDTVSMILTYRYDYHDRPFEVGFVYEYLRMHYGDARYPAVQGVWQELERRSGHWTRVAIRSYSEWMTYMKGIWNQSVNGFLPEVTYQNDANTCSATGSLGDKTS
ncbi:hypothetical protein ACLMJK_005252 [Lecanora helva]